MSVAALRQLRAHPLRTVLTLLGMVFGVGAVVAMSCIGAGAQEEILRRIEAMGATVVHVLADPVEEDERGGVINDSQGLTRADVHALAELLSGQGARLAYATWLHPWATSLALDPHDVEVIGVDEGFLEVVGHAVAEGRPLHPLDHGRQRSVVLVGPRLARDAGEAVALGRWIRLNQEWFEVVGVLQERRTEQPGAAGGQGGLAGDPERFDRALVLPWSTLHRKLAPPRTYGELDAVTLTVASTPATLPAKRLAEALLLSRHGGVRDFRVVAPEELLRQRQETQRILNAVLISIAAISLLVGGIGVMNIMLANILERISEIGLRRAVGATRGDIFRQFLTEAVVVCFMGGAAGVGVGLGLAWAASVWADLPVAMAWPSMLLAFAISVGVGVVFGFFPARQAALIQPIQALHNE